MARLRRRAGTEQYLREHGELVVLDPVKYKGKWHELFGNDRPIHVELGMGKGEFIVQMSERYDHINFIGIDLYDELLRKACEKAEHLEGSNLKLVRHHIVEINEIFAAGEVERFYLNFSDPWPKNRHARRRLTHPSFVEQYVAILNEDGEIHMRTDSRLLFEFSLNTFADMDLKMRNISLDLHGAGTPEGHIFTEYEQKFVQKGMNIYRCEVLVGRRAREAARQSRQTQQTRQTRQTRQT